VRAALSLRSIAGQMFVLLVAAVTLLVAVVVAALVLQAQHDSEEEARERALAVAETFAHSPGMLAALSSADPTTSLQPRAEEARRRTGVAYIVATNPEGIRYTHPNEARIGQRFSGRIGPAAAGRAFTETHTGTLGRSIRAVVPVTQADGSVVGLVSTGVKVEEVAQAVNRQLPILLGAAAATLALATGGVTLASKRLRRQTHGLGPAEITRMYEHHDAVLHAVREGVLVIDGDRRLLLANDEAHRLLDLPPNAQGRHVTDLGLRRATTTDEGGRGLFLIAQLTQRWGTRYTTTGKIIWAEQPLPPVPA
jgi:sensor histidine kinase regulating citrate/malate metabolism